MRRVLIAGFAPLLALALIAPAAGAKTQTRYLEGKVDGGGRVQFSVKYLVKSGHKSDVPNWIIKSGNKRFIPKRLTYSASRSVQVSCIEGNTVVDESTGHLDPGFLLSGGPRPPGKFAYAYPENDGKVEGQKMWRKGKRARASGTLKWTSTTVFPPSGPPFTDCTTDGPRSWSAHECRRGGSPSKGLPVCSATDWS